MAEEREDGVQLEFKSGDGAWYDVSLALEGTDLLVHYLEFTADDDERFSVEDFKSVKDLRVRFRFSSQQLQDENCGGIKEGTIICASFSSNNEDIRFYDAIVQGILRSKHHQKGGEEVCRCTFEVLWKDGPSVNDITKIKCENICLLTSGSIERHPTIKAFLKLIEEKDDQSFCKNIVKKKAANVKGNNATNYNSKPGEHVKTASNFVNINGLEGSCTISGQENLENHLDSFNQNVGPKTTMEAVFFGINEAAASTPYMPPMQSQSCNMEELTNDRLNAVDNDAIDCEAKTREEVKKTTVEAPLCEASESANESSHSEMIFVEQEETQVDSLHTERKEEKLNLDLNSKIEIEGDLFDIPSLSEAYLNQREDTHADHAVSARTGIKRPPCYKFENIDEQVIVEESRNDEEIREKKKVLSSSWGKGKRQKHINNELFTGERKVQDHNQTSENISISKKIQDDNDFNGVDSLSSSYLTPHLKNSASHVPTETLIFTAGMDKVDAFKGVMNHVKVHKEEESLPVFLSIEENNHDTFRKKCDKDILDFNRQPDNNVKLHKQEESLPGFMSVEENNHDTLTKKCDKDILDLNRQPNNNVKLHKQEESLPGFMSVEENNHDTLKKKCDNEILDLNRQHDNYVQLQEGLSTPEEINEGCKYGVKSGGQNNPSFIDKDHNHHHASEKSNYCYCYFSHVTDMPSCDCQQDFERCQSLLTSKEFEAHPAECKCCDLHSCDMNTSSEDESFDVEVTSCNCCGNYLKPIVWSNRPSTRTHKDPHEAICGSKGAGLVHCSEDIGAEDRFFSHSEVLVLDNLEKDVRPSDVKKVVACVTCVVQVYIFPSLKFEQFTRGFVWFQDHSSLMKALALLQNDDFFFVSSKGRPWVALLLHIDDEVCKDIFGGYDIESEDCQHCCSKTFPSKILRVNRGTDEYEQAKKRKNLFLEFKEHLAILHKRLEFEECSL